MKDRWLGTFAALTGAAILALFARARALPGSQAPNEELTYQTSCSVVESNSVDGFVTNASQDTYEVRGEVRFKFVQNNSMSRPELLIQANSLIPGGETARVARARLLLALRPNEACVFDVAGAIRKQ